MAWRKAAFTYEESEAGNLYYFAPETRAAGPYAERRRVEAIIDLDAEGRLAGVELIDNMPPLISDAARLRKTKIARQRRAEALVINAFVIFFMLIALAWAIAWLYNSI